MEYVIIFLSLIIIFKIIFKPCIKKCAAKLPSFPYKLFYTDEKNCENKSIICSKLLVSEKYNICGKPDLVYKNIFNFVISISRKIKTIIFHENVLIQFFKIYIFINIKYKLIY